MQEFIGKLLSNVWVVAILGGIISGIIVYLITKRLFERKDRSRHIEMINNANADIIRMLKPYVAEKGLPDKVIIDAIILSAARKYSVKSEELYSTRIICEEIIREIVENVYVSSEKKQEYTNDLKEYLYQLNIEENKPSLKLKIDEEISNNLLNLKNMHKKTYFSDLSLALAFFTSTVWITCMILFEDTRFIDSMMQPTNFILIALSIILITMSVSTLLLMCIKIKERKNKNRKGKDKDKK